jgi:hypothetical protein
MLTHKNLRLGGAGGFACERFHGLLRSRFGYLNSGLLALAGSADQFWWMVML